MFAINNKYADYQDSFGYQKSFSVSDNLVRRTMGIRGSWRRYRLKWARTAKFAPFLYAFIILTNEPGCGGRNQPAKEGNFSAEKGREVFAPQPKPASRAPGARAEPIADTWSIVLASVFADGDPAELDRLAAEALRRFQTKGDLPEAYIDRRGRGAVIVFGRYPSPESPQAQADLRKIRGTNVDGGYPFADAFLSPPPGEALHGADPQLDLRNARKNHGGKRAAYTLQIAAYARPDRQAHSPGELKEFREAAEKAAAQLRREGELAFYFHGPNSSSVTIGVFSADDIDSKSAQGTSPALRDARTKHPRNLLNGKGINEKAGVASDGRTVYRLQSSMVVGIPD